LYDDDSHQIKRVFGGVVTVAFQITFRVEMHANDFFYFLKIIFDISTSIQNIQTILNFSKKNK